MNDPFDLSAVETERPAAPEKAVRGYLDSLNEAQSEAVHAIDGPVLVLAGAGTGKTRVLTTRLVHILDGGHARPGETLTVTFTNKAAREMKARIERLARRPVEGWHLGTFHSIAARLLRRHAELVGLKSNFTIIDTDDQVRLLKQVLAAHDIDEKKWPARALGAIIDRWKNRGLTADQAGDGDGGEFANGRAAALYRDYQERLKALNAADFGDLLLHNLSLFAADREVLRSYQARFKYILVDEYQDSNVAQYLWLRLLAQGHRNICCVGDDDQSIYAWRGAEVGNILRFEKDFPGARVIRLERNYRSTRHILGAASGLISHNRGRLGKTLWSEAGEGERVMVRGLWDGEAEARAVGEEIEALARAGQGLNEIAVLVRAGHQPRRFEERFIEIGLPYRVVGVLRFYERLEIRDAIAYLRVIAQDDDDLAFERIANKPKRGIGIGSMQKLHRLARARRTSLIAAARELVESDELRADTRRALKRLVESIARWRARAESAPLAKLAQRVLDESGYVEMWRADRSVQAPGRVENLDELIGALDAFEDLETFLEHVSLVMDQAAEPDGDMVNLMTLHGAKGLEFDVVYLPGWEEGLFPHQRAVDDGGLRGLEEERRLAYVGLTRARRRAVILYAANRNLFGKWVSALPSRFVGELPEDHIAHRSDLGAHGAGLAETEADFAGTGGRARPDLGRRRSTWHRYAWRAGTGGADIAIAAQNHAPGTFRVGLRVFHQKFGYGKIAAIDGNKLEIAFDKAGTKKVIDSFVAPA